MTSAEECRTALQKLAGRLGELSPAERDEYFGDRTISVTIPDLNVTFVSHLGSGDDPVREELGVDAEARLHVVVTAHVEMRVRLGRLVTHDRRPHRVRHAD